MTAASAVELRRNARDVHTVGNLVCMLGEGATCHHIDGCLEAWMEAERHWRAALGELQMDMPRASFETWVRDAELLTYEDGLFVIGVQNAYARDWLEDRLLATVKRVLAGITGRTVDVRFVVWHGETADRGADHTVELAVPVVDHHQDADRLNSRYTFDTFVVGSGNRLAAAAAQAVAERPAYAYNPLFLYGGVGLGKTHLLHAIGQACRARELKVLYVSSEEFTNDLVNAIRSQQTEAFRDRYRRAEVLLIDDIQFIAGKESTQEEFFHTFNTLHGQDRQLVISSDRPPKALVTLEERLRSRFEWGLTADIYPPDFETRLAILRSKAERVGCTVASDYLEVIAHRFQSNVRELEGALTRVLAFSDLTGTPIGADLVENALAGFVAAGEPPDPERIIEKVADAFGLEKQQILGRGRSREVALARQIAMYLIREETKASLPQVGEALGGRDHTTVMHGCGKIVSLLETDDALRRQVRSIRDAIYDQASVAV